MYSFQTRVRYSECNTKQEASLTALLDYLQDCCTFQSEQLGVGVEYLEEHHVAWILSSWQVDILRYPKLGEQLIAAIRALGEDPYPDGHVVLGGREGFRIRVRQHRVLYSVVDDRLVVEVFRIGPRSDVYK